MQSERSQCKVSLFNAYHMVINMVCNSFYLYEREMKSKRIEHEKHLWAVGERLGYRNLTDSTFEAILQLVGGCDVLVVLPIGSGTSACFAILPWLFDALQGVTYSSIVIVVVPLNAMLRTGIIRIYIMRSL